VKPAPFAYHAPARLPELLELRASHGGTSRILAGGQSLMPLLNMRRVRTEHLIDINGVDELAQISDTDGTLELGALVRQAEALTDPAVRSAAPLVPEALAHVASPTVRNRGTVCGSIAFAQPTAQLGAAVLATGGEVVARSPAGERAIALDAFFTGPYATALRDDEVVTAVRLTRWPDGTGHAFAEVSRVRQPVASAAALVELDGDSVSRCAVAVAGASPTPVRAHAVEEALTGRAPTDETIAEAAGLAVDGLDVPGDVHGTSAYRSHVARVLVRRACLAAVARARGEGA
jgi:aerobic carbon-monoxide dehydrogenase medium subunit